MAAHAGLGASAHAAEATAGAYLRYLETTEATYAEVVVDGEHLRYRYFEDATGKCARWIEQRPCWSADELTTAESALTPGQIDDLVAFVRRGGFMALGPAYGETDPQRRSYPMELTVRLAGAERRVVYRARPEAAPMPAAFARLRARLLDLARQLAGPG